MFQFAEGVIKDAKENKIIIDSTGKKLKTNTIKNLIIDTIHKKCIIEITLGTFVIFSRPGLDTTGKHSNT